MLTLTRRLAVNLALTLAAASVAALGAFAGTFVVGATFIGLSFDLTVLLASVVGAAAFIVGLVHDRD